MDSHSRKFLVSELQSKEFRDEYVAQQLRRRIANSIKSIRDHLGMNQKELAAKMGKHQTHVSRIESFNYGSMTVRSLLEIFAALDVAVTLTPMAFSQFLDECEETSPDSFVVENYSSPSEQKNISAWATRSFQPNLLKIDADKMKPANSQEMPLDESAELKPSQRDKKEQKTFFAPKPKKSANSRGYMEKQDNQKEQDNLDAKLGPMEAYQ